ncbi:MAG: hypothetical protein LBS18_01385 [Clostridiales bacterium]|nr:hypothetical protein [Clostridiales bacterium]
MEAPNSEGNTASPDKRGSKEKPANKRKRRKGVKWPALLAIALLLGVAAYALGLFGGGGLPVFGPAAGAPASLQAETPATGEALSTPPVTPAIETPAPAKDAALVLEVDEDAVRFNGEVVPLQDLKYAILQNDTPGGVWQLIDNHAIKATYDQVKAALMDCAVVFVER